MNKYFFLIVVLFANCEGRLPFDLGNGYCLDYDRNSYHAVYNKNHDAIPAPARILLREMLLVNVIYYM